MTTTEAAAPAETNGAADKQDKRPRMKDRDLEPPDRDKLLRHYLNLSDDELTQVADSLKARLAAVGKVQAVRKG